MINEHDRVVLTGPVAAEGLAVGDVGTVAVHRSATRRGRSRGCRPLVRGGARRTRRAVLSDADRTFARILERPLQCPAVSGDVRRALLHTFPYAVYFLLFTFARRTELSSFSPCCTLESLNHTGSQSVTS